MKAISLWQPWASLWLTDAKVHETRHWPTSYRGWLLVHAAKRKVDDFGGERIGDICDGLFGHHWGQDLPRGAIIGAVNLIDCLQMRLTSPENDDDMECGTWSDERFAWHRSDARLFDVPIPYRGMQGIFNVPDEIVLAVLAPLKDMERKHD